jgi:hypothetical protein
VVTHACGPSYTECQLGKISERPYLEKKKINQPTKQKNLKAKGPGAFAQVLEQGPESNPQYCKSWG